MGMIVIEVKGSFGNPIIECFSATKYGHAHAVNEAIKFLVDLQHDAINEDHKLHSENCEPQKGFQKTRDK